MTANASIIEDVACVAGDFAAMFPEYWWTGLVAVGSYEDLTCSADWWDPLWLVNLRQIIWPCIAAATIVCFFAFSCCIMPRVNGPRDQTGLCGKLGSALTDRADRIGCVKALKRLTKSTWNGKLLVVFKHFNKSKSGALTEEEFTAMFSTVGDQFVDANNYAAARHAFGARLTLDVVETMYSLGCRTWRERTVQVERDYERVLLLSGKITHSDYLVRTGSIGMHGMKDVEEVKAELKSPKKLSKKLSKKKEERERRVSAQKRAAKVLIAAQGGPDWGSAVDEEFEAEHAMTELERFSVPLPSLYVETLLFAAVTAFIFLFIYDTTRWFDTHILGDEAELDPAGPGIEGFFNKYAATIRRFFTIDYLIRWISGFFGGISDVGHKVCIFHFFFILLFVFPQRIFQTMFPTSCCAKAQAKRMLKKAVKPREFGPPPRGNLLERAAMAGARKIATSSKVTPAPAANLEADGALDLAEAGGDGYDESKPHSPEATAAHMLATKGWVPKNSIINTSMTLCDKIKLLPIYFIRDVCNFGVRIVSLVGIDLSLFVFFEPFINFTKTGMELAHIRMSGISLAFNADNVDCYMRWLNLKIVNLLSLGIFEKYYSGKADDMYLGFLDAQIKWNAAPANIPKGIDTSRSFEYFTAGVSNTELFFIDLVYFPTIFCFPIWPACCAKHRETAMHKLMLSKYRFGGRQPRLGGDFIGSGKGFVNTKGCARVFKINSASLCCDSKICGVDPVCQKKYENVLDANLEWVVPPVPKEGKCACRKAYWLLPFPFDTPDEENLSIDTPIPIIVEDPKGFAFWFPDGADPEAFTADDVAATLTKWVKSGKGGGRGDAIAAQTAGSGKKIDAAAVAPIIAKETGGAKTTLTIFEMEEVIHYFGLIVDDVRISSPVFRRVRSTSGGALLEGLEAGITSQYDASAASAAAATAVVSAAKPAAEPAAESAPSTESATA